MTTTETIEHALRRGLRALAGTAMVAGLLAGPASAASLEDVIERLDAIQRENAAIRKENAAMRREISALRKERSSDVAEIREAVSARVVAPEIAPLAVARAAAPAPDHEAGPYDWSGFHAGAFAGYGWGDADWGPVVPRFGGTTVLVDNGLGLGLGGGLAGVQAGFDYQAGNLVLGAGASLAWAGIGQRSTHVLTNGLAGDIEELETNINWTGTVTGRLGYAFDNVLVYAKGGAAVAGVDDHWTLHSTTFSLAGQQQSTLFGWTAGAGAEFAFGRNWSAGLEYAYSDFGSRNVAFIGTLPGGTPAVFSHDIKTNLHQVKVGLNYRFGAE